MARPKDWIGLYVPGAAPTAYIEWIYVSCSKTAVAAPRRPVVSIRSAYCARSGEL